MAIPKRTARPGLLVQRLQPPLLDTDDHVSVTDELYNLGRRSKKKEWWSFCQ